MINLIYSRSDTEGVEFGVGGKIRDLRGNILEKVSLLRKLDLTALPQ